MRRSYLLLLSLLAFALHASASSFALRNFDVDQGLPSTETHNVFQDSKGYIWIATDAGVSRYDGYSFTNFTTREGLPDNTVFSFYEDHKGRIWFRTFSGALCYYQDGRILCPAASAGMQSMVKGAIPVSLHVDEHDTLWLSTHNSLFKVHLPDGKPQAVTMGTRYYIKTFSNGGYVYGREPSSKEERVGIATPQGLTPVSMSEAMSSEPYSYLRICVSSTDDRNFYLSIGSSIYRIRNKHAEALHLPVSKNMNLLLHAEKNYLWVGQQQGGVIRVDLATMDTIHLLKDLSVCAMLVDKAGGYWFCTTEKGVFYLDNFEVRSINMPEALGNVQAIAAGKDALYIGAAGGLYRFIPSPDSLIKIKPEYIRSLCYTGDKLYVGGIVNIYVMDAAGREMQRFTMPNVQNFFPYGNTVYYQNPRSAGSMQDVNPGTLEIPARMHSFYAVTADSILLGTRKGLYAMVNGSKPHRLFADARLLDCRIEDIQEANGTFYFATRGNGLVILRDEKFFHVSKEQGLRSDICHKVFVASNGNVYVCTTNGIAVFRKNELVPSFFISKAQGMASGDVQCIAEHDGYIYTGTSKGISVFPLSYAPAPGRPPFLIESVRTPDSLFHFPPGITLAPSQGFFSVHFVALCFDNAGDIIYRYRIPELDSSWKETANTFVNFSDLPRGNYTFEVYPLNALGQPWSEVKRIPLTLVPYFYQTRWFLVLCVLAGIIAITATVSILYRRKLEKSRTLTRFAELELKALRSQINPHLIFNCLTSVQSLILKKDVEGAEQYLRKFSTFLRDSLNAGRENFIRFNEELRYLELYVELESMRLKDTFNYTFDVDPELIKSKLYVPPMMVQPYVENAIWHGLQKKHGEKKLTLTFSLLKDHILITVHDNGIGRKAAALHRKELHRAPSLGMKITDERMEMHSVQTGLLFSVVIYDEHSDDGTPAGTRVELTLPLIGNGFLEHSYSL